MPRPLPPKDEVATLDERERPQPEIPGAPVVEGFLIEREIGAGSMGTVYLAMQRSSGYRFALKVVRDPPGGWNRNSIDAFCREVETRAMPPEHKNVVSVKSAVRLEHAPCLMLKFVKMPTTLADFHAQQGGQLGWDQAAPLLLGILDGLAFLHSKGQVYRELKRENILLAWTGMEYFPMLSNFGMSAICERAGLGRRAGMNRIMELAPYWPKEHAGAWTQGNPASEVFMLAAFFYHLMTGYHPRQDITKLIQQKAEQEMEPTEAEFEAIIQNRRVIPIRDRNMAIKGRLSEVIDRALAEPDSGPNATQEELARVRYANAGEFLKAVEAVLTEQGY